MLDFAHNFADRGLDLRLMSWSSMGFGWRVHVRWTMAGIERIFPLVECSPAKLINIVMDGGGIHSSILSRLYSMRSATKLIPLI